MKPADQVEVLTANEAATFLRMTRRQLYRLPIPCSRIGRRTRRYFRDDLVNFLTKKRFSA